MTKRRRNMQMYGPAFKVFEFDEVYYSCCKFEVMYNSVGLQ